ncbi:uncharacterized protein PITG_19382 [Phytophthora infestans T30-4]|uniref:Secreted RxLR effector peptide protein n=1 Tax=Phytophthora infestans (strain T30-4) TaxID=403677 RepID=D0P0K5_PHYIT|nr:uncharacterized protein PITG_19382 [Phytophthora infestans T30-4]EEY52968.1 conserved hypothetical protein [Phytophthora infestans T30-4]|eukprot:XP_002896178.1 conserved hypothetical protein [Phytophthora infestans T30-4]
MATRVRWLLLRLRLFTPISYGLQQSGERETDAYFGDRGIVNTREEGEHAYADVQTTHMKTVRATTSTPARHLLSRPSTQDKIAAYIAAAKKMMVACRAEKTKVNPEKKPAKKISQAKKKMSKPTLTSRAIESKEACELLFELWICPWALALD